MFAQNCILDVWMGSEYASVDMPGKKEWAAFKLYDLSRHI